MNKFLIVCILCLGILKDVNAQRRYAPNLPFYDNEKVHFGFLMGINNLDFKITTVDDNAESILVISAQNQTGLNLGVVSNFKLNRSFDFRVLPTLSLASRRIQYSIQDGDELIEESKEIESTLVGVPLLIKYKSERYKNTRAYVITGFNYSFDLASLKKANDKDNEIVKIVQNDIAYEIGVGFDFYLAYFKFSTEVKGTFGLTDVLYNDQSIYTSSIESMKTRGFTVTLTFE
jgi:hypothetical protein